jgi:hypothetical protein
MRVRSILSSEVKNYLSFQMRHDPDIRCQFRAARPAEATLASTSGSSGGAVIEHGFSAQSWLTFRHAMSFDGNVRTEERGTSVVYADRFLPNDKKQQACGTGSSRQAQPVCVE